MSCLRAAQLSLLTVFSINLSDLLRTGPYLQEDYIKTKLVLLSLLYLAVFSYLTAEPQVPNDRDKESSTGAASLALYGGTRGILHAYSLSNAFDSDFDSQTVVAASAIMSIAELFALHSYATKNELTAGQAEMIGTYGDIFLLWGAGFAQYNNKYHFNFSSNTEMMFGGSVIGMISGAFISKSGLYTRGDSYMIRGSSMLGGCAGAAIALQSNMNLYNGTLLTILCSSIGLYAGDKLTKDYDFNTKEGIITNLAMQGGALVGATVGALTLTSESVGVFPALTVLGGGIGFVIMASYYKTRGTKENPTASNFKFNLNPIGAMVLVQNSSKIETSILNLSIDF